MIDDILSLLRCPLCGGAFHRGGSALICPKGHCYDVARQGYVNFVPDKREMFYKKALFEARSRVFGAGVYQPVVERLGDALRRFVAGDRPVLVDVGCGEGYYTRAVCPERAMTRIGFDLSKEAVRLAARVGREAAFFAADLKRIPLTDGCADAVLDIFTPADYAEFARVLRPGGVVIKLAPRGGYLAQLRAAAGDRLRRRTYDGGDVARYARERMHILSQETITYTREVTPDTALDLARMTPMLAGVDVERLDLTAVREITIDETMFVGTL